MKVKAHKLQYKMRKLKERDERKQTLDARIYPVVRIATKAPPTSTLLKYSRRVSLLGNQVSSVNTIMVTLIPISTKGDCPRRRGLRPPHNVVDAAPHQAGGSLTCRRATNAPRDRRTEIQVWFTLEPATRITTLLVHSLKELT